jgi:outer membrane receptor protein involved in Fe transport
MRIASQAERMYLCSQNKKETMKAYILLTTLLLSIPSFASAGEPDSDSIPQKSVSLDEIVITSYKEHKNLQEVPASVSLVSAKDLKQNNIVDFKEISASIPNLYFPDYGSKLTSPLFIRGIGSKLTPSVGLYVDGVPFFDKSVFDFDMNEVSRLEVLRGPQSTLYGRNTMGGIINVYTKNPLDYQGFNFRQMTANYGQTEFAGSYYGKISDKVGYSVSSKYKHNDGFFTNKYNGEKVDDLNHISSKAKLQWRNDSGLNGLFFANYEYTDQGGYPFGVFNPEDNKVSDVDYNEYSYYRQGVLTSGLTLSYPFRYFTLKSVTGYQHLKDRQAIDQDFTEAAKAYAVQTQRQNQFSQELEMRSNSHQRWTWLNGIFGFYNTNKRAVYYLSRKNYKEPSYGLAVYHQSTINNLLFKRLSLTLGVRLDLEKDKQDYKVYTLTENPTLTSQMNDSKSFAQFTPKFSLQYQFNHTNMIYATTTRGYRTGGFNVSFDDEAERTYSPEYSWNYEVGSKFAMFHNRLSGGLSLFYIDWRHQQIAHMKANKLGQYLTNAGRSYSKGVELSLQARPIDPLSLQFSYGYTEAKFKEYIYNETDYSDNYLPYVPEQTLMLSGNYTLNLRSRYVDRLNFSAQYVGTGRHYWSENNAVAQGFYGLLNGKVSASKKNLTVDLWIKNATSRKYNIYLFQTNSNYFAQKGKPLTFGTTIAFAL